jgi:hypothetical protein
MTTNEEKLTNTMDFISNATQEELSTLLHHVSFCARGSIIREHNFNPLLKEVMEFTKDDFDKYLKGSIEEDDFENFVHEDKEDDFYDNKEEFIEKFNKEVLGL